MLFSACHPVRWPFLLGLSKHISPSVQTFPGVWRKRLLPLLHQHISRPSVRTPRPGSDLRRTCGSGRLWQPLLQSLPLPTMMEDWMEKWSGGRNRLGERLLEWCTMWNSWNYCMDCCLWQWKEGWRIKRKRKDYLSLHHWTRMKIWSSFDSFDDFDKDEKMNSTEGTGFKETRRDGKMVASRGKFEKWEKRVMQDWSKKNYATANLWQTLEVSLSLSLELVKKKNAGMALKKKEEQIKVAKRDDKNVFGNLCFLNPQRSERWRTGSKKYQRHELIHKGWCFGRLKVF